MSRRRHPEPPRARPAAFRPDVDPALSAPQPRSATRGARPTSVPPDTAFRALLPLRFFLGGMFLYAGIDKLVDPAFLRAAGAGSVAAQLEAFVRVSPLAPFVSAFAVPFPVPVGLLMSIVEIAIGLGALTGILYRASAAGGAFLTLLFFLTASWDTRPFYYGPDLPYMVGWVTLALAEPPTLLLFADREPELDQVDPRAGQVALELGRLDEELLQVVV